MNVSALEEYGLRCAVQLAALEPEHTLSAPEIAEREGLSVEYVSKFMLLLKRADLVRTVRGINGGFALAKTPSEISLNDVFEALGAKKNSDDFCSSFVGKSEACVRGGGCSIRPFWKILSLYVEEFTREMTLQDLLQSEEHALARTIDLAQKNIEQLKKMHRQLKEGLKT
ncbi:MAG: Rrf2 family transcriptional regulator [Bdellovibrionales bacterium]|nr:Rrf2 family transcriptional regulator [Oligoflexia bacterium]